MHLEVKQAPGFNQGYNEQIVRENSDVISALKRSISKLPNTPDTQMRARQAVATTDKLTCDIKKKRKLKKVERKYEIKEGELRRKSIAESHTSKLDLLEEKMKLQELWIKASYRAFLTGYVVKSLKEINTKVHLFGTSKGFKDKRNTTFIEQKIMKQSRMINPEGKFRRGWDMIVGLLLVYTALALPYRVAFEDATPLGWMIIDGIMDCFFVADIVLNFLTGFREKKEGGKIIMSCRRSSLHYIKGWFVIDLLSTLPFQLIELATSSTQSYNKLLRLARLPRLYRLLRIFKCVRIMRRSSFRKCFACLRIKTVVTGLALFFAHLVACFWFLFAKINEFGPDTWVAKRGVADRSASYQYLVAFYWSVQTITTVGFGDVSTASVLQMLLSLLWMILGVGFYSFVMGNFSSMIASIDSQKAKLRSRLGALDKFAQSENIPEPLYIRIKLHIQENLRKQDYVVEKKALLDSLPPTLKMELIQHTHGSIISTLKFFESKSWNFIWSAVPLLKALNFAKYEIVYRQGDISDECYFIMVGKVSFSTQLGVPYRNFLLGMIFGDVSLLREEPRNQTAITATKCELLTLSKLDFKKLMSEFPEEARLIKEECDQKHEYLKSAKEEVEKLNNIEPIFYELLEARTCWINFGESFAGIKGNQTRPSLQDSYKISHNISGSFHSKSKSISIIPNPSLNRKFTKQDSETRGADTTTDREQNFETDRTDERRSNPTSPTRDRLINSRIQNSEEAVAFQREQEKPIFYNRNSEAQTVAWEQIRLNILGMVKEIKNSSNVLTEVLESVVKQQQAVQEAVKMTNQRILGLKNLKEEKKEEEKQVIR